MQKLPRQCRIFRLNRMCSSGSGHESVSAEMSIFDPTWPQRLSPFGGPVWYDWPMESTKPLVGKFRRLVLRSAIAFSGIIFATFTHAAEPYGPDPALSPEEVVQIQLQALQVNNIPTPNAGIRQAWILAHPDNRRVTGPLPRFERMINGAAYRPLLGHTAHDLERLATTHAAGDVQGHHRNAGRRGPGISLGGRPD